MVVYSSHGKLTEARKVFGSCFERDDRFDLGGICFISLKTCTMLHHTGVTPRAPLVEIYRAAAAFNMATYCLRESE